jgi:uncharacterized protein (TIGR03067 family)
LARLQGKWKVVKVQATDQLEIELGKFVTFEFKGDKFTITIDVPDKVDKSLTGTIKIDPTKTPKTMDFTAQSGPEKGKTTLQIYQLDGDTLKIHRAYKDGTRPTDMTHKKGETALHTLKRVPK